MSRGGFRGGRGGRGGGRGGLLGVGMSSHDAEMMMAASFRHPGVLFPPLTTEQVAFLPQPSAFEEEMIKRETELEETLRKGLLVDEVEGTRWCGWRLPEVRKTVGIEIETYSDMFARPTLATPQEDKLDPVKLKMDPKFFPPSLWDAYFAPEKEDKRSKARANQSKKRKLDLDSDNEGEKADDDEAEKSSNASSEEEDAQYEDDSDHDDYDANYFDNGEGDDDEGGEEGGDEGGGGFNND